MYKPTEEHSTTFGIADYDYITVTTFDSIAMSQLSDTVDTSVSVNDRFRGYTGLKAGGIRLLSGEQKGQRHFIVIGEGNASWHIIKVLRDTLHAESGHSLWEHFTCTRIDVQIAAQDNSTHFRKLADNIRNPLDSWRKGGKAPAVTLIEGEKSRKGLGSTLYVGSRKTKHGTFTRIYEKEGPHQLRYLRFEPQFKGKKAQKVLERQMKSKGKVAAQIVKGELDCYPASIALGDLGHLYNALGEVDGEKVKVTAEKGTDMRRALWFKYTVARSLAKMTDMEVIRWTERELLKLAFVLKNKVRRREVLLFRLGQLYDEGSSEPHLGAQLEATEALILEEYENGPPEGSEGLPEQGLLWSIEEFEAMVNMVGGHGYSNYM